MGLIKTLMNALSLVDSDRRSDAQARPVEVVIPEGRRVNAQELVLSKLSEQEVYGIFLGVFVGGTPPPNVKLRQSDEVRFRTLDNFVRAVFSEDYLVNKVGAVDSWSLLDEKERTVFAYIQEARKHLKMPDRNGVRNSFMAVYNAEQQGLRLIPPVVAHERFRPDIVTMIRYDIFGGGLGLVKKIANYGDVNWDGAAAEQLLFVHSLAQRYGPEVEAIIHRDLLDAVTCFGDRTRRSADLLRRSREEGERERANEIERTYITTTEQLQMPLPLRALRLAPGNAQWQ